MDVETVEAIDALRDEMHALHDKAIAHADTLHGKAIAHADTWHGEAMTAMRSLRDEVMSTMRTQHGEAMAQGRMLYEDMIDRMKRTSEAAPARPPRQRKKR